MNTLNQNNHLYYANELFTEACKFIAPIIARNNPITIISNFAMTHMLTDSFPELSRDKIHIVIETTQKIYLSEQIHTI